MGSEFFFNKSPFSRIIGIYRVAQKSKPLPSYQNIVLKPVGEIRFISQITVSIKHYNIIRLH